MEKILHIHVAIIGISGNLIHAKIVTLESREYTCQWRVLLRNSAGKICRTLHVLIFIHEFREKEKLGKILQLL